MTGMAGYQLDRNELDQRMGRAVTGLRDALDEVAAVNAMLQDTTILGVPAGPNPVDPLTTLDQPYTAGEITNIRNGMFALALGTMVMHGQATVPSVSDFFFFAKHLAGARW
jgi:hypothetical protein